MVGDIYNFTDYGHMVDDHLRMDSYAYAIKKAVYPGAVVLDIGTSIGIHALLACKFGARKVYAVEPNNVIDLAASLAATNGYGDQITFIHDISTNITLPERADVIVSDLRGILPLFDQHIPSIIDARQRHLAPQGTLIPQMDKLWLAVVETPTIYNSLLKPWDDPYGFDMQPARQMILQEWHHDDTDLIQSSDLLTVPFNWAVLDYYTIDHPDVISNEIVQTVLRGGMAHGLLIWFDAELSEGIGFSNGPHVKKLADVYGRGFFPFPKPVSVASADKIQLDIQANLTPEGYRWRWRTSVYSSGHNHVIKAAFDQSNEY